MTLSELKNLGWLVIASFIVGAGLAVLDSNITNVFVADKATAQVVATGGVLAAVSVLVLFFTPLTKQFGIGKSDKT